MTARVIRRFGRSPGHAALPDIRTLAEITDMMFEVMDHQFELADQGLWPVPRGVTVWRDGTGQWRRLPNPTLTVMKL